MKEQRQLQLMIATMMLDVVTSVTESDDTCKFDKDSETCRAVRLHRRQRGPCGSSKTMSRRCGHRLRLPVQHNGAIPKGTTRLAIFKN
eukprot:9218702-Karenia_brevis.AAC.1